MWDNHEFCWLGWQTLQKFDGSTRPAQTRKVAANQAWFEFQPARVAASRVEDRSLERFDRAPRSVDAPVDALRRRTVSAQEPNNLTAIGSLTGYRALRFGRHIELMITDQHSYRSEEPTGMEEADGARQPRLP